MYLILDTTRSYAKRHGSRLFLVSVRRAGRELGFTANPEQAMRFPTRRLVDNFREKYPHIGGRVVLLASALKRAAQ